MPTANADPVSVIPWLLDSDPAIRWQVMRELMHQPAEVVEAERSRIASEGWGSRLLDLQGPDGNWGGAPYTYPGWTSTTDTLLLLRDLGLDPTSDRARKAIAMVRDNCTWGPEFGDSPYFEGEVEPCINGRALISGAYFGEGSDWSIGCLTNSWRTEVGTARRRGARGRRSTPRSAFSKGCRNTRR